MRRSLLSAPLKVVIGRQWVKARVITGVDAAARKWSERGMSRVVKSGRLI